MNSTGFSYLFRQGVSNIKKNKLMSFASVAVLASCLVLIGFALILAENVNKIVRYTENQNEIVVILKDDTTAEDKRDLEQKIFETGHSAEIVHVSKEEALDEIKASWGQQAALLDGLENDNPLPDSIHVKLTTLDVLQDFVNVIKEDSRVFSVNSPDNVAKILGTVKNAVFIFDFVLVALLIIVSLLIISNTVRLTVFSRRKEINIMRFVGATNRYIRTPFIIEGLLIGLLACAFAYAIVYFCYRIIESAIGGSIGSITFLSNQALVPFSDMAGYTLAIFLVIGVLAGTVASVMSMRKHLRV